MKRNKYKDYLWYTALAVFIICVIEGIFFYHNVENPFLKVTLNIQNAIKAYKIDPDIKQKEAIAYMQATGGGILSGIITYVYCIAVIVAPFCTIGALAVLIRKPASYVRGLFSQRYKKRVLVIGEGKYKFPLIDALTKDCRVTVVESTILSDDKKLKYINKGVKFVQKYQDMHIESIIKMLDICKFSDIFLCDDNSIENIECLNAFTKSFKKNINAFENKGYQQIHLCCNDNSMAELIRQYYDKIDTRTFDLDIVDVNKMAVNKMYKEHPVYTANKGDSCINIPIVVRAKENNDFANIYGEKNLFTINRNKDIFSYASITNRDIVNDAKIFNHRYNMLYEIISRYKADKNIVVDDKFMLSEDIEERLKKDSIELKENKKISEEIDEVWHNKGIFDRESSIAQSLHQDIKKWIIYEKHAYSLTDNREELERIEHRRWNIFMITHGFKYEKAERKDMYAKTHPCISKWEVLKVEKPDTLEYDFTPYYILKADR